MSLEFLGPMTPLAADLVLVIGMLLLLVADLVPARGADRGGQEMAALTVGVLCSALLVTVLGGPQLVGPALMSDAYVGGPLQVILKQIFLMGGILAVLGSTTWIQENTPRRQGEYYLLLLASVLGMNLLAGARDMILLVVCFELMGIPLYVLAAWSRDDKRSVEGALKLFLTGAVSSVTLMYGLSVLFGLSGTTSLAAMAAHVATHPSPLALVAGAMALSGMGFKLGVFPFHMWVPDTYEGSSTPFVAFLSVAPKAAGLIALVQVLTAGGNVLLRQSEVILLFLIVATLIAGNLLAINQSNVKRMLGYSGVAHMGFLLMAVYAGTAQSLGMLVFYLLAYLFTNIGAFLVVHAVANSGGDDTVSSFDGLIQRSGWLSFAMLIFLLSLGGIPFVSGFWAKIYVFLVAWMAQAYTLVILGALLSVVGLFYYLRIARAMLMNPPTNTSRITADPLTNLAIAICLVFVVGMGLLPGPFVNTCLHGARVFLGG